MQILVNRLDEPLIVAFDGQHYTFLPGEEMALPDEVARHLRKRSLIRDNPITGEGVFALAIKGLEDTECIGGKPVELLDRSDMEGSEGFYRKNVTMVTVANDVRKDGSVRSALDTTVDVDNPRAKVAFRRV
jgi:hypothetical protein